VPRARRLPSLVAGAGDLITQINVAEVRRCAALHFFALLRRACVRTCISQR
jgi:hypothetical protein